MRGLSFVFAVLFLLFAGVSAHFMFGDVAPDQFVLEQMAYQEQMDETLVLAEAGDVKAQAKLGLLYLNANKNLKNLPAAAKWLRTAADRHHPGAQYALGKMHETGNGMRENHLKAIKLYEQASIVGGHREAQFSLAEHFYSGQGIPQDYILAMHWYKKAANQGHPIAQYLIGVMFSQGWGSSENFVEGYKWLTLALPFANEITAHNKAYDAKREYRSVRKKMNSVQTAEAKIQIEIWLSER